MRVEQASSARSLTPGETWTRRFRRKKRILRIGCDGLRAATVRVEFGELLPPLGGLGRLSGFLVKLRQELEHVFHCRRVGGGRLLAAREDALVACAQQRFSLLIFFLREQNAAQANAAGQGFPTARSS